MLNRAGKTLTIFIVVILVLLSSATSIGFFLYNKELQLRTAAEGERDVSRESEAKLQGELKEIKKQILILQDKNKEADGKINNLLDEVELNEGLRNELKKENAALREQVDGFNRVKDRMKADADDLSAKLQDYQALLKAEQDKSKDLQGRLNALQEVKAGMESTINEMKSDMQPLSLRSPESQVGTEVVPGAGNKNKVELDRIVVSPQDGVRGRVLSVDKEAEFLVCNLGHKQGVNAGDMLSVYRGEEYLGDIKATRVQEEMSAADIVPPFSSRKVRKNDIVVLKQ